MDATFEQFVRQELHKLEDGQRNLEDGQRNLEDGQRNLEDGQRNLEKAIGDSQTRITQWVVGLFVGMVVIIVGLSSVLLTSFMLVR